VNKINFYCHNVSICSTIQNSPIKVPSKSKNTQRRFFEYPLLGGKYVFEAQDNSFFLRNYEFQKSSKKNLKYEGPETVGRIRDHLEGKAQKTIFFMKLLVLP
jgi:hypothetical protein